MSSEFQPWFLLYLPRFFQPLGAGGGFPKPPCAWCLQCWTSGHWSMGSPWRTTWRPETKKDASRRAGWLENVRDLFQFFADRSWLRHWVKMMKSSQISGNMYENYWRCLIQYLVGGLEYFLFFHILGIPTDFHIFQRGRSTTNQIWSQVRAGPTVRRTLHRWWPLAGFQESLWPDRTPTGSVPRSLRYGHFLIFVLVKKGNIY